jgi:CBS domain-containing protein
MRTSKPADAESAAPPELRGLKVADVMTTNVVTIRADASLSEAVTRLADSHVSGLAVVDGRGRLIGVVSATDVLGAEAEAGDRSAPRLLETTVVREVMTPRPLTIGPELNLREAALQMDYADVHRLFVEFDGKLVGVISRSDINRAVGSGKL